VPAVSRTAIWRIRFLVLDVDDFDGVVFGSGDEEPPCRRVGDHATQAPATFSSSTTPIRLRAGGSRRASRKFSGGRVGHHARVGGKNDLAGLDAVFGLAGHRGGPEEFEAVEAAGGEAVPEEVVAFVRGSGGQHGQAEGVGQEGLHDFPVAVVESATAARRRDSMARVVAGSLVRAMTCKGSSEVCRTRNGGSQAAWMRV